jgi:hypothetical protein
MITMELSAMTSKLSAQLPPMLPPETSEAVTVMAPLAMNAFGAAEVGVGVPAAASPLVELQPVWSGRAEVSRL